MPRDARFRPVRDHALGIESDGAVVLPVLGLVHFASGLVLPITCVADLASPASAAGGNAPLETSDQRELALLSVPNREIEGAECQRSARGRGACVDQKVRMVPAPWRTAHAAPWERDDECPAGRSRPGAERGSMSLDLRCDLAAMAASQRRMGFVYVGLR
jgi:hypothetical protein